MNGSASSSAAYAASRTVATNGSATPSVTGRRASLAGTDRASARLPAASCWYSRRWAGSLALRARVSKASAERAAVLRCWTWKAAVRSNGSLPGLALNAVPCSGRLMMSRMAPLCHRQSPKHAANTTMQKISRLRSSSRCSTRLRRSSWRIGRRVVATPRPALLALLGDDLVRGGRRRLLLGAAERAGVVVLVRLAGDRVLELAHARAELAAEGRQSLGTEDQKHDPEHDQQLEGPDGLEEGEAHQAFLRSAKPSGLP